MANERRTAVLIDPRRVYGNVASEEPEDLT
jgi:hypothetical protein